MILLVFPLFPVDMLYFGDQKKTRTVIAILSRKEFNIYQISFWTTNNFAENKSFFISAVPAVPQIPKQKMAMSKAEPYFNIPHFRR